MSRYRSGLAVGLAILVIACVADAVLFLQRAGEVLTGGKLVVIVMLGLTALVASAVHPRPWLLAVPVLAALLFRGAIIHALTVPEDAVIRDAQAGLAAMVVVGGQVLVVALGLGLANASRAAQRPGQQ